MLGAVRGIEFGIDLSRYPFTVSGEGSQRGPLVFAIFCSGAATLVVPGGVRGVLLVEAEELGGVGLDHLAKVVGG